MIKIKNNGNVLLYVLILVSSAIIIAYIVFSKSTQFVTDIQTQRYSTKLNKNIHEKAEKAFKYNTYFNTDGSGFVDTRSCPSIVTLSGTTALGTLSDITNISPYFDGYNLYCSGSSLSGNLLISYANDFLSYSGVSYLGGNFINLNSNQVVYTSESLTLTGTFFTGVLDDINQSYISFSGGLNLSSVDNNFDSDNYTVYSTGFISYPNGYIDNDSDARLAFYGYVEKNLGYYNIFWNNYLTNTYIANNPNNNDFTHELIGNTSTGYLMLDVDNGYDIKIIEFNSGAYKTTKELKKINEWRGLSNTGSIGYISQDGSGIISISSSIGSAKIFDFKNKDYAIFLSFSGITTNTGITLLRYKLTAKNDSGSGIFINPIDDSSFGNSNGSTNGGVVMGLSKFGFTNFSSLLGYQLEDTMKYLGNDIIIDDKGNYIAKEIEKIQGQ